MPPDLALRLTLISSNCPFLTNFHGFKGIPAIEVWLSLYINEKYKYRWFINLVSSFTLSIASREEYRQKLATSKTDLAFGWGRKPFNDTCFFLRCMGKPLCFSTISSNGNNVPAFLFGSLLIWGLLLKERICSYRGKFFHLRVDLHW